MQGVMKAMPSLMNAYNKSQPDLNKAKPHLLNAYEQAEPHLMQARPHLQSAFMKAQPDIKNAFDNSFNDFNEAYQKSRPYIGAEVINMGQRIRGSPNSVTENVMGGNKNNSLTHASQSAETPLSTQTFNVNNTEYSTLSNGLIAKKEKVFALMVVWLHNTIMIYVQMKYLWIKNIEIVHGSVMDQ